MAICDLSTSITRLQRATSDLREQWLTAKEHWNDATNDRFERDYLNPLAPPISGTLAAKPLSSDKFDIGEVMTSTSLFLLLPILT